MKLYSSFSKLVTGELKPYEFSTVGIITRESFNRVYARGSRDIIYFNQRYALQPIHIHLGKSKLKSFVCICFCPKTKTTIKKTFKSTYNIVNKFIIKDKCMNSNNNSS